MPDLADPSARCITAGRCRIRASRTLSALQPQAGSLSLPSPILSIYLNSVDLDSQCCDLPPLPHDMPHASKLSRQDTLPAEEPPSWSYSSVPGQPAPIPPRNEPLLFIPNHGTAHGDASLACSSLKSINSDSETLKTSSINIINADHHSDNVTICSPLI